MLLVFNLKPFFVTIKIFIKNVQTRGATDFLYPDPGADQVSCLGGGLLKK
jgi:hypothetical protein